jgi:hypothetical protein
MSWCTNKKCCCTPKLYMQWRRCDTGALAPLWSEPSWPEGVAPGTWPQYMLFAGDGKCYKRLGTEPTSTNPPADQIVFVVCEHCITGHETEIDWPHLFFLHPEGKDCSYIVCAPGSCGACTDNDRPTPSAFLIIFREITIPTGCFAVDCGSTCCDDFDIPEHVEVLTSAASLNVSFYLVPKLDGFGVRVECLWTYLKREIRFNFSVGGCDGCSHPPDCGEGPWEMFVDGGGEFDPECDFEVTLDGSHLYMRAINSGGGSFFLFDADIGTLFPTNDWCNRILTVNNELPAVDFCPTDPARVPTYATYGTGGRAIVIPLGVPIAA